MNKKEFSLIDSIPVNIELEKNILSILLNSSDSFLEITGLLDVHDFFLEKHKTIFRILKELTEKKIPYDLIIVKDYIEANSLEDQTGGIYYLMEISENFPNKKEISTYSTRLKEKSYARKLMQEFVECIPYCKSGDMEKVRSIVSRIKEDIHTLSTRTEMPAYDYVKETLLNVFKNKEYGILTGLSTLDTKICGLPKKALSILAARPSMGKTALALNIAVNVSSRGVPVIFYSLEMSGESLAGRLLSSYTKIPFLSLMRNKFEPYEWDSLEDASQQIKKIPLFIDEHKRTVDDIKLSMRRMKHEHNVGLVVIDYLQLMSNNGRFNTKNDEISDTTKQLKGIATDLDVSILLLSQLSREVERRVDKRPMLSDLRDSGAIEQDADVIMSIYRDCVYNPETQLPREAELIINKNRNGERNCTVFMDFNGAAFTFTEKDRGEANELPRYESGREES